MKWVPRILVGIAALLSMMVALRCWFDMAPVITQFAIIPEGLVGRATVRADIGGMFMGMAVMGIMAAWKESRSWAIGMLVFAICAISGRLIGVIVDGAGPGVWPPIGVELVVIAILLYARVRWSRPS